LNFFGGAGLGALLLVVVVIITTGTSGLGGAWRIIAGAAAQIALADIPYMD